MLCSRLCSFVLPGIWAVLCGREDRITAPPAVRRSNLYLPAYSWVHGVGELFRRIIKRKQKRDAGALQRYNCTTGIYIYTYIYIYCFGIFTFLYDIYSFIFIFIFM